MAKTNYGQLKKQKEAARKARQQKKLDRRQSRVGDEAPVGGENTAEAAATPQDKSAP